MAKRYKHLYPLFFVTLLYMLAFQILYYCLVGKFYIYKVSAWYFILNVLCIQTGWLSSDQSFNGPAWCISVEIFLYIIYYITTKLAKRDKNTYIIISGIVFTLATVVLYLQLGDYPFLNKYMMRGVACFYAGVLLSELNDWIDKEKKEKISVTLLLLFILFRVALYFSSDFSFWENEHNGQMALILIEWPILIFASINLSGLRKILEIRPLKFLGTISMDVFLWHIPVQITIKCIDKIFNLNINYGAVSVWLMYIIITLVVATVSNYISKRIKNEHYLLKGIVAIACCVFVVFVTDITGARFKPIINNSLSYSDFADIVEMNYGKSAAEDFYIEKETDIQMIQFYTITWNKKFADGQKLMISIKNKNTGEKVYEAERFMNRFRDANSYDLELDVPVELEADTWYTISFESNTEENQETMALLLVNTSGESEGQAYVDGQSIKNCIATKLWTKK